MKNNRLLYLLIIILTIWCAILSSQVRHANAPEPAKVVNQYTVSGFSTDLTKIYDENKAGIVTINADGNILSGFVYRQEEGTVYIVSAYHGLADTRNISVRFGSSYSVQGNLLAYDIFTDLAIISIETPYDIAGLRLGDASLLKPGEFLLAIGTPVSSDYDGSAELCIVSKNNFQIENMIEDDGNRQNYFLNVIELGSSLQNGYSGSPLMNMGGEVVGMVTMSAQDSVSFAITANEIRAVADKLISLEEITRHNFGVKGTFLNDMYNYEKANLNISLDTVDGFYVERVMEGSMAYEAGVRNGDVITMINNNQIIDPDTYFEAMYADAETFSFTFIRDGQAVLGSPSDD